jgi:hypothetical protein
MEDSFAAEGKRVRLQTGLKHWTIGAFEADEDNDRIESAVSRLVRKRAEDDGADDAQLLRILQHPALPPKYAFTLLFLVSLRRGKITHAVTVTILDVAHLRGAVRVLAQSEDNPLQQCMMAFSALFPPRNIPRPDLLLGGSHVAETLLRGDLYSKQKAARLVVRLHELYEEREPLAQVTDKVAEWLRDTDHLPALVVFQRLVRRKGTGSMGEVQKMLPGVTALDFGWIYESMVADAARRKEGLRRNPEAGTWTSIATRVRGRDRDPATGRNQQGRRDLRTPRQPSCVCRRDTALGRGLRSRRCGRR